MKEKEMKEERYDESSGNKIMKEQLQFYKTNNCKIHVELKNGRFYNGDILELAGDMIILEDMRLGAMPIYFIEINVLEKYRVE